MKAYRGGAGWRDALREALFLRLERSRTKTRQTLEARLGIQLGGDKASQTNRSGRGTTGAAYYDGDVARVAEICVARMSRPFDYAL